MSGAGRLFVVDDNPANLALLAGILRDAGHQVRLANSGRRALAALQQEPAELVLLDITMPELDGYEVCAQLKADPRTRDVPILFLSALDDVKDKVAAFRAGGADYVTKPFQGEEVLARVDNQLKLLRLRRELEARNRELDALNLELKRAFSDVDKLFAALTAALPGTVLEGRYRFEERIGAGGFAAVYRATHLPTGREVAVKVLRPQPGDEDGPRRERFRREGVYAVRVGHPNAVEVLDAGETPAGLSYLVMELLRGRPLSEELAAAGPLQPARAAQLLVPVCSALADAHRAGVLHRDVKPTNLFLHRGEGGEVVKVVDFGIARSTQAGSQASLTTTGRLLGTPCYMAPERLLGTGDDARSDVYSLGVTLFEALSGRLPFDLGDGAVGRFIVACVTDPPRELSAARPGLPAALCGVVMRTLSKRPEQRPTLEEVAAALLAAAREEVAPPPAAPRPRSARDAPTLPDS